MKKRIITLSIICLLIVAAQSNDFCFAREKYKNSVISSYDVNEIKIMENNLFHFSFDNESVERRLERLELKVFNMVSTDSYKNRITALKSYLNGSNNYSYSHTTVQPYYQYYHPTFTNTVPYPYHRPFHDPHSFKTKINAFRNLKSYLNGTMTGYTLPIQNNSYSLYNTPNSNNFYSNGGSIQEYSDRWHNYRNFNTNDGGINVKIID